MRTGGFNLGEILKILIFFCEFGLITDYLIISFGRVGFFFFYYNSFVKKKTFSFTFLKNENSQLIKTGMFKKFSIFFSYIFILLCRLFRRHLLFSN